MRIRNTYSRTGSVYLVTLITVGAIVSMVFIGLNMRLLLNSQSAIVSDMSSQNSGVFDAAEMAIERIVTDTNWKDTAQSGVVINDLNVDGAVYSSTVIDADTAGLPDADTTNYRVKVASEMGQSWSGAQFDLLSSTVDYTKVVTDLGATNYWPMNEAPNTFPVEDPVGSSFGTHVSRDTAGAGTNDEGGIVPVFQNSTDAVVVGYSDTFIQADATISYWVNLSNAVKNDTYGMLGMRYSLLTYPTFNISVWQCGISAYVSEDGDYSNSKFAHTAVNAISQDQWHHIAVSWGARGLRVYVDGTLEAHNAANTEGTATTSLLLGGKQALIIGGGYLVADRSRDYTGFTGSIAHVALFNLQLSNAQVAELAAIKPDLSSIELVDNSWVRVLNDD